MQNFLNSKVSMQTCSRCCMRGTWTEIIQHSSLGDKKEALVNIAELCLRQKEYVEYIQWTL